MSRIHALALASLIAFAPAAPAATAPAATPSPRDGAKAVLQRYLDACGGLKAIAARKSWLFDADIAIPAQNLKGTVKAWQAQPDRMLVVADLPGVGKIEQGYDGKVGWSRDPLMGSRYIEGKELDQLLNQPTDLTKFADLDATFKSMALEGRKDWQGQQVDVVQLETKGGSAVTAYFDPASGLQVGMEMKVTTPLGEMPTTWRMSEYKTFGGLMLPARISQSTMGMEQLLTIRDVSFDLAAEALPSFSPPKDFAAKPAAAAAAGN